MMNNELMIPCIKGAGGQIKEESISPFGEALVFLVKTEVPKGYQIKLFDNILDDLLKKIGENNPLMEIGSPALVKVVEKIPGNEFLAIGQDDQGLCFGVVCRAEDMLNFMSFDEIVDL